jgi:inosine-uridine nucleoside N-ribohydrolase
LGLAQTDRETVKVHLDTDLGGDIDDLCALALLLALPDLEITGITTVGEEGGRRRGYVEHALRMAGRSDIPVRAGADVSSGYFRWAMGYPNDADYWPEPIAPIPNPLEEALVLLERSIELGATVVAIGPFTNLLLLDQLQPGIVAEAPLYVMGYLVRPIPPGYPQWDISADWNVQSDVAAAQYVLEKLSPTIIPCEMTAQTSLRRAYLPSLRQKGGLAALIARQAEAFARDERHEETYGKTCAKLPSDTINFQHDPLACAVAWGWSGAILETLPLRAELDATGFLRAVSHPEGKPTRLVTWIDGRSFGHWWYDVLARQR